MRIGRVLHQQRTLLAVGLIALLALASGCGGGEVAPPVTPPGEMTPGEQIKSSMRKMYGTGIPTKRSAKKSENAN